MMTESSRSSGTSDLKDTCQSPAGRPAKLQFSASCEVGGMMSWSSATSSMVLEEIWLELLEKLFADLWKFCINGWDKKQYDQICNWAKTVNLSCCYNRPWVWVYLLPYCKSYCVIIAKCPERCSVYLKHTEVKWFVKILAVLLYWVPCIRENYVCL